MAVNVTHHQTTAQINSEKAVIEAAKKDPVRFEPLYNKYYENIFRFIYARLDDKETAFDITSQVFLKALSNLKNYEFKGLPFSSWLYRIAVNELNMLFRSEKAQRTVNIETAAFVAMAEEIEEDSIEKHIGKLPNFLAELPEDELQLIEMRFFEKRPFKEIAEILDITENNAKVKTYRLLEKLRKQLLQKDLKK